MEGKKVNNLVLYFQKWEKSTKGTPEEKKAFNMLNCFCLSLIDKTIEVKDLEVILGFCPPCSSSEKKCIDKIKELNPLYLEDETKPNFTFDDNQGDDYDNLSDFVSRSISINQF